MPTIYKANTDRISIADAKRLILKVVPSEPTFLILGELDAHGDVPPDGRIEIQFEPDSTIHANWINCDFLEACEQLGIQPRMRFRPVITEYKDETQDLHYTMSHDEFVRFAEFFSLSVSVGEAPVVQLKATEPQPVPGNALNEASRPVQRFTAQDAEILTAIREAGHNPLALPRSKAGKKGVKFATRSALKNSPLFIGSTVFDKAWDRLIGRGDMTYEPDHTP